jgi:hypothetical protein
MPRTHGGVELPDFFRWLFVADVRFPIFQELAIIQLRVFAINLHRAFLFVFFGNAAKIFSLISH